MKHLWLQSLVSHSPPITLSLPPLPHSSSYYPSRSFAQLQQPAQKLSQRIMCYAKKILIWDRIENAAPGLRSVTTLIRTLKFI